MPPAAEAAARGVAPARPRRSPGPRVTRISGAVAAPGIARPRKRARPVSRPRPGIAESLVGSIAGLPQHRLLDRLIRGRLWIGLVAFALIGIVAMQLAVLELNTQIGRSLAEVSRLQRENPAMSIENSTAAAGENVEPKATARGMEMASVATMQFLTSSPTDVERAAQILSQPSASTSSSTAAQNSTPSPPAAEAAAGEAATSSPAAASQPETAASNTTAAGGEAATANVTAESPAQTTAPAPPPVAPAPAVTENQGASASTPVTSETGVGGGTQAGPQG
jgi:hypothetical protein